MKKQRINLRLPPKVYERLKEIAKTNGRTITAQVERMIVNVPKEKVIEM